MMFVCNNSSTLTTRDCIMNLLVRTVPLNNRAQVASTLELYIFKVNAWCNRCNQWGMKLNPIKIHSLIISRSKAPLPVRPHIIVNNYVINDCTLLKLLAVTLNTRTLTSDPHLKSVYLTMLDFHV